MIRHFWDRVDTSGGPGSCWEWQRCRVRRYGALSWGGKPIRAHRLAWELTNGPVPPGLHVLHRCDNPPCCNPNHLFLGTHQENHADMVAKRRHAHGEKDGRAILRAPQVITIRALYATGRWTQAALAEAYGVDRSTIGYIIRRRLWRHVA